MAVYLQSLQNEMKNFLLHFVDFEILGIEMLLLHILHHQCSLLFEPNLNMFSTSTLPKVIPTSTLSNISLW